MVKPMTIRMARQLVLITVRMVCSSAAVRTPRTLIHVSSTIDAIASTRCRERPISIGPLGRCTVVPRKTSGVIPGISTATKRGNAAPTAAMAPVWITANSAQPYRNPGSGDSPSRR
jgi:hypothetical protein